MCWGVGVQAQSDNMNEVQSTRALKRWTDGIKEHKQLTYYTRKEWNHVPCPPLDQEEQLRNRREKENCAHYGSADFGRRVVIILEPRVRVIVRHGGRIRGGRL